jgi:hypothetical protein
VEVHYFTGLFGNIPEDSATFATKSVNNGHCGQKAFALSGPPEVTAPAFRAYAHGDAILSLIDKVARPPG